MRNTKRRKIFKGEVSIGPQSKYKVGKTTQDPIIARNGVEAGLHLGDDLQQVHQLDVPLQRGILFENFQKDGVIASDLCLIGGLKSRSTKELRVRECPQSTNSTTTGNVDKSAVVVNGKMKRAL